MLDSLSPNAGSRRPRKRKGRGRASGSGKTCGRGQKGAGARSGRKRRPFMEGGQMPLARRLPKVGFRNLFRTEYQVVNLDDLARFDTGAVIDVEGLVGAGLAAQPGGPVKLLGRGDLSVALTLKVNAVSASAKDKVEKAGGSIELVAWRRAGRKVEKA